jgi:hypothetical protein
VIYDGTVHLSVDAQNGRGVVAGAWYAYATTFDVRFHDRVTRPVGPRVPARNDRE